MANFNPSNPKDNTKIQRLLYHHDHLKALNDAYNFMWASQTIARMKNPEFKVDDNKMKEQDEAYFTSLIVRLSVNENSVLFNLVNEAYTEISKLIKKHYPKSNPEIYLDSAHITIKSILDKQKQDIDELNRYKTIVNPIIAKWLNKMSAETLLYARGLFTNSHPEKGLSIGIKFFPSTPLIQIIRGKVGVALYNAVDLNILESNHLREEWKFHTMLTHSTGFRVRDLTYPLKVDFVEEFEKIILNYERVVFGNISDINKEDIFIRNGKSYKLKVGADGGIEIAIA